MGQIKVTTCPIEGLYVIEPAVHGDARGYFMETYNRRDMEEAGLNLNFVQDNQSASKKGVLRGSQGCHRGECFSQRPRTGGVIH